MKSSSTSPPQGSTVHFGEFDREKYPDRDDDGLTDFREVVGADETENTNDDLLTDPTMLDTDGDRLQDGTEVGEWRGHPTDTRRSVFIPDADQGATTTDPQSVDTDGGGLDDGVEDVNLNGRIDLDELDPNHAVDDVPVYDFTSRNFSTEELDVLHTSNVVMVTRNGGTVSPSSVTVLLIHDTGTEDAPSPDDIITIEFPEFVKTMPVPIKIAGDTIIEPDETIFIMFVNLAAAQQGTTHPWTDFTILDDDLELPKVESVQIDDGNQRSMVRSLTIEFDDVVTNADEAFAVTNETTNTEFQPIVSKPSLKSSIKHTVKET